ncbi:MAG: peptidylprolyl isomerase [bacterium]
MGKNTLIKTIICIVLIVPGILLFSGCKKSPQDHSNLIVAMVNDQPIYLKDVESLLKRNDDALDDPLFDIKDTYKILKKQLLDFIIDNELLFQEAKKQGITISDEEFRKSLFKLDNKRAGELFSDSNFKEWREQTKRSFIIQKLIDSKVSNKLVVNKNEIYDYFQSHSDELGSKKRVRARHIIVDSEIKAREILAQLRKGADFEALAKKVSLSPDSKNGGDLGLFSEGQMPPEFDEAIFKLKKDEISNVIHSDYGYHIFQLVEIYDAKPPSLEDSTPQIRKILRQRKRDEHFQNYLDTLHSKAEIKINPKALFPNN